MKRTLVYSLLVSLAILLAACSQTQAPPLEADIATQGKDSYSFKGEGASAHFYSDNECSGTSISVFIVEGRERSGPGGGNKISHVDLNISHWNWCEGTGSWGYGSSTLTNQDFSVNVNRGLATLSKDVEIFDYDWWSDTQQLVGVVHLDLVWEASSGLVRTRDTETVSYPGYKYRYSFRGSYREATVSGIASFEGADLIAGLSGYGQIFQAQGGTMSIVQDQRLPPRIDSFRAEPEAIAVGESTTLSWQVSSDRRATLSIEGLGDVTGLSSITVAPTETTTYELIATNRNGSSSALVTVWVIAPDHLEPNNHFQEATPVAPGFFEYELTMLPGDVDWFAFSLTQATDVYIYLGSWMFEARMGLFDEGLNELANDTMYGLYVGLEAGTYYLAVSGAADAGFTGNHNEAGFYYLEIQAWTPPPPPEPDAFEPNNSYSEATSIALDFYNPDLTVLPGDVDWFVFTLTEAADLNAYTYSWWPWQAYMVLGLFDEALDAIVISEWNLWAQLQPGTYYLAVSGYPDVDFEGAHGEHGNYELSLFAGLAPPPPPPLP